MRLPTLGIIVLVLVVAAMIVAKLLFKVTVMFAFGKYVMVLIGVLVLVALLAPMITRKDDDEG